MLAAAGAAKLGYGHLAAGTAAVFIAAKLGAAATAVLTAHLGLWVGRLEKQQQRALVRVRSSRALPRWSAVAGNVRGRIESSH